MTRPGRPFLLLLACGILAPASPAQEVLHELFGKGGGYWFGYAVAGAGDVDADGHDDVVVGIPYATQADRGRALVLSGADGAVLHAFKGTQRDEKLGLSVDGAGDANADGFADLVVASTGKVRVFSGRDGSLLHALDVPADNFSPPVSGAGDVNGDGHADVLVGTAYDLHQDGSATVVSGREGAVLFSVEAVEKGSAFGVAVGGAGDVDGDGFADLVVGAYLEDENHADSGSARVYSGCSAIGRSYCGPAAANSTGRPAVLGACGSPAAVDGYLVLRATNLPPAQQVLFLVGRSRDQVSGPGGSQGDLCIGGPVGRFDAPATVSGPDGVLTLAVDLSSLPTDPPHAVQPGETWFFQAWYRDQNPTATSNFTDAVAVEFE